jgi:hypothetical protein
MLQSAIWNPLRGKPVYGSGYRLNPEHPLNQGLVAWWLMNEGSGSPFDIMGRSSSIVGAPTWSMEKARQYASASDVIQRDPLLEPSSAITVLACVKRTGTLVEYARPFGKTNKNGVSPYLSYDLETNAAGAGQDKIKANILLSVDNMQSTPNATVDMTVPTIVGLRYSIGNYLQLITNGIVSQSSASTYLNPISYDTASTGNFIISGASSATVDSPWNGLVYWCCLWNRWLLDNELISVRDTLYGTPANPRLLLPSGKLYFFPSGGVTPSFKPYWISKQSRIIGGGLI